MGRRDFVIVDGAAVENTTYSSAGPVKSLHGEERNGWWHEAHDRGDSIAASVDWKFGVPPLGSTPMPNHVCDNLCFEQETGCVNVVRIDTEWPGTVYIEQFVPEDELGEERPQLFRVRSKKLIEQPKTTDRGIAMIGSRPNRIARVPNVSQGIKSAHAYPSGTIRTYRKGEQ